MTQTPARRAAQKRYRESAKGRATTRAWEERNREHMRARNHAYYVANRDKLLRNQEARRQANRVEWLKKLKVRQLRTNHGMFPEDWATLWHAQDGLCYLCGKPMDPEKSPHIDHDHSCCAPGKSCRACRRGLSHSDCNLMIGLAGDDPAQLRLAADALEVAKRAAAQRIARERYQQLTLEGTA